MKKIAKERKLATYLYVVIVLGLSTLFGLLLYANDLCVNSIQTIYIFAVFLITRKTVGYLPGIIASGISTLLLNYVFIHPHFSFTFLEAGHLLTTLCMLAICVLTSTMVTSTEVQQENELKEMQEQAQRDLELEQERAQKELEIQTERMRTNLLRSISHDLRTPLTSIAGCARTVMENYEVLTREQKDEMYAHICEDAERLIPMVENVLMITKVNGDLNLTKVEEAVDDIIGSAVTRFHKHYPEIKTVIHTPEEVLLVPMDATLIVQVLVNIMLNSVEHGETTTTIWLNAYQEGDYAVFTVEDDGVGFSQEHLEHNINDGKSRNLGIGLECCRAIVKAHGGAAGHWNREKGGAFTQFTLPLGN